MTHRPSHETTLTNINKIHNHNKNNINILLNKNLYIITNNIKKHTTNKITSQITINSIINFFHLSKTKKTKNNTNYNEHYHEHTHLKTTIKLTNLKIFKKNSQQTNQHNINTTIITLHLHKTTTHLTHIKNSQIYHIHKNKLKQITTNHS